MVALFLVAAFSTLVTLGVIGSEEIPDYIHICKRNDPKLNECITNSIEELRPHLLKGIPELNVPPIEPLFLKEVPVAKSATINAVGKDLNIFGPGSFIIKNIRVDLDKHLVEIKVDLPLLIFDGQYEVSGKLLTVPLSGKGAVKANATDCKADVVLHFESIKKKDGKDYLFFKDMDINLDIGGYHVHLDNLFDGNKALGDATNQALNENSKDFIEQLKPVIEETVGNMILKMANNIFLEFSFDKIMPLE